MNTDTSPLSHEAVMKAIEERRSVRSYTRTPLSADEVASLRRAIAEAPSPWGPQDGLHLDAPDFRMALLEHSTDGHGTRLGTYGVISHAPAYIGLWVRTSRGAAADMAGAYALEHVVVEATAMGLGTCWLGGTFRPSQFSRAFAATGDAPLPGEGDTEEWALRIVVPVGHAASRRGIVENILRSAAKSGTRKPFDSLFFDHDFQTPYAPKGEPLSEAFRAVRLAPSASNRQPWRMIAVGPGWVHLFAASDPGFQAIDAGIAMAHLDMALGRNGSLWHIEPSFPLTPPQGLTYMASTAVTTFA